MNQHEPHILILGTADWNQSIATNQHYMTRELAESFRTTFVESLGLRRPEFTARDLKRMARRLRGSSSKAQVARPTGPNIDVISPKVLPAHNLPWSILNRRLLDSYFKNWRRSPKRVFWSYSPVTYGFEMFADVSVYHCVDLYAKFPGIDAELIDREERRLARTGITAAGSSKVVVQHLEDQGFSNVLYWPNVADTSAISSVVKGCSIERDGAIFAGNLSEKKVDFELLENLLESGVKLHLAGPIAEGGGESRFLVDGLIKRGAKYHGALTLGELSKLMAECKVGLIPYKLTPYTRGVSPLKTYEYLAAGLAVVSTPIPGVTPAEPHVSVSDTLTSFVDLVRRELEGSGDQYVEARRILAEENSWLGRGREARILVERLLSENL